MLFPDSGPLDPTQYEAIKEEVQALIQVSLLLSQLSRISSLTSVPPKAVDKDGEKAEAIEKGFTGLAQKIREFEDLVEATVTARGEAVAVLLQQTREELASLRRKLSEYVF